MPLFSRTDADATAPEAIRAAGIAEQLDQMTGRAEMAEAEIRLLNEALTEAAETITRLKGELAEALRRVDARQSIIDGWHLRSLPELVVDADRVEVEPVPPLIYDALAAEMVGSVGD